MSRLYCADIIKCDDALYESEDTLVEYAIQNPETFIIYSDIELLDATIGDDGLEITYRRLDEYDENDNEIYKVETESFSIEYVEMMVTVPEL